MIRLSLAFAAGIAFTIVAAEATAMVVFLRRFAS